MVRMWTGASLLLAVVLGGCASSPKTVAQLPPGIDPSDPLAPTMLMQEGQMMLADGRTSQALERFRQAEKLQPTNPVVHNVLGVALLQAGKPAEAVEAFTRALTLAPTYTDARTNRGTAYLRLGQFALAESDFLAALQDATYPNRAAVFFNLGSLHLARGRLEAALDNLQRAAVPTGPVEAHLLLGQLEEKMGRVEKAEEAYRAGMARAPERPDFPLRLGLLLYTQGREAEAKTILEKVVQLAPDSPEASQAKAVLGR